MIRAFLTGLALLISAPTLAADLISAGSPDTLRTAPRTSNENQIDMLQRQQEYREKHLSFKQDLLARQQSFAAPRREMYSKHGKNNPARTSADKDTQRTSQAGERLNEHGKPATPIMWKVSDANSEIILVGTMHVLPEGLDWQQPALMQALEDAASVWLEAEVDTDNAKQKLTQLAKRSKRKNVPVAGKVTAQLLNKEDSARLTVIAIKVGLPANLVRSLPPKQAAAILQNALPHDLGFKGKSGLDMMISAEARKRDKPLHYFETLEEQVGFIEALPSQNGEHMLFETLNEWDEKTAEFLDLYQAWRIGDLTSLTHFVNERKNEDPAFHKIIQTDRNEKWVTTIEELMNGSGNTLMAVGAAHLAGADSVPMMLKEKGYKVERIGAQTSGQISQLETPPGKS